MLKYKSIIDKMSLREKIALLTDFRKLSDEAFGKFGIPEVRAANLGELALESDFFSYESAACSWDPALIGRMTEEIASRARNNGVNLLSTPDLKCIVNPYLQGLSEDSVLNGEIGAAISRAVHSVGAACALNAFSIDKPHTEYLDCVQNQAAVHEFFIKPFRIATEEEPCDAIYTKLDPIADGAYSNAELFRSAANGRIGELFVIGDSAPNDIDVHDVLGKGVHLGGAELTLSRAIGRYVQLASYQAEGSITEREFNGALHDGSAIDEKTLDEAVDHLIDFAFRVNQIAPKSENVVSAEEIGLKIAQESIVLLKNERLLPLDQDEKIALFGDLYEDSLVGLNPVGTVKGFSDVQKALEVAKESDVLLVFLADGSADEKNSFKPSSERINFINALKRTGKRMIAVLKGSMPVDMSFDRDFSAVLTAPGKGKCSAAALAEILTGKVNPSGKLTKTYYDHADAYFRSLKSDKNDGRTLVGTFIGYRRYDTAQRKVRYPFGFGLSYTRFVYSGLEINGDEVSFTLKNVGNCAGCEVVQVYVGRRTKSGIVPKKELKAFVRVELEAGESRKVTLNLPREKFASFDECFMSESVESGCYTVFIGASVQDVRLKGLRTLDGDVRQKTDEKRCDYFRDLSNIGTKYRMGTAGRGHSKPKTLFTVGISLLMLSLFLLIAMGFVLLDAGMDFGVFVALFFGVVGLICSVALLVFDRKWRKERLRREARERLKQQSAFSDAEMAVKTPSEVFKTALQTKKRETAEGSADEPRYFDRQQSFLSVFAELKTFTEERGLLIEENHLRNFLAACASSRLLIVSGRSMKQWNRFCEILSEYFGSGVYADNAEDYASGNDLFCVRKNYGVQKTALAHCCEAARNAKPYLHLALLRHLKKEKLWDIFVGILPDLNRKSVNGVEKVGTVPPNVWLVAALEEGADFGDLPKELLEIAALLDLALRECEPAAQKSLVKPLGYYQFEHLCESARREFALEERQWKQVDNLQERIGSPIGNRLAVKLERHFSAYRACGGDAATALDAAVSSELLLQFTDLKL